MVVVHAFSMVHAAAFTCANVLRSIPAGLATDAIPKRRFLLVVPGFNLVNFQWVFNNVPKQVYLHFLFPSLYYIVIGSI